MMTGGLHPNQTYGGRYQQQQKDSVLQQGWVIPLVLITIVILLLLVLILAISG